MTHVKVGDTIKIIKLDNYSQELWPQFAGTEQIVVAVDRDGDPRFDTEDLDDSDGGLWVEQSQGGEFKVVMSVST